MSNGVIAVAEGANMPSDPDAVHHFLTQKVLFGPAKAANAGGVAVSGLEQTQNSMRLTWSRSEVDERLRGIMLGIHETCVRHGGEAGGYVDYVKGLYKVLEKLRAKYPKVPMMLCSGGGGRVDYEALKYFTEFWASDDTDPLERIYMQWEYSYFYPAIASSNHVTDGGKQPIKYRKYSKTRRVSRGWRNFAS